MQNHVYVKVSTGWLTRSDPLPFSGPQKMVPDFRFYDVKGWESFGFCRADDTFAALVGRDFDRFSVAAVVRVGDVEQVAGRLFVALGRDGNQCVDISEFCHPVTESILVGVAKSIAAEAKQVAALARVVEGEGVELE